MKDFWILRNMTKVAYTMIERAPTISYLCIIVPCFVAIKVANRRNEQRNSDNPQTAMGRLFKKVIIIISSFHRIIAYFKTMLQ